LMQELRNAGLSAELFHEPAKMDKQFKYAEKKFIPLVAILGTTELASNSLLVKELATGKQEAVPFADLIGFLKK